MAIFHPKAAAIVKNGDNESDVKCSDVTQRGSAGFVHCLNRILHRQYVTETSAGVGLFDSRKQLGILSKLQKYSFIFLYLREATW
jgi:hypothetical protein